MLIQIFYLSGLNIFVLHFLMNGPKRRMGSLFSENKIFRLTYGPDVLKLLIAVDELNIQQLISHIQEFLINHKTEFLHQNPTGILEAVYQHETFTELWNFCLEKVCEEPKILFN